jgi:hypothetical protein
LPFNFFYDGRNYSTVEVSTNGIVTFDGLYPAATQSQMIGNPQSPNRFIAPWWDDLQLDNINDLTWSVEYSKNGTPNDVVIQWTNLRHSLQGPCVDHNTRQMEVRLFPYTPGSPSFCFSYGTTTAGNPGNGPGMVMMCPENVITMDHATVGFEDGAASPDASFVELMCSPNCNEGYRSQWCVDNFGANPPPPGNWLDGTTICFVPDPLPNPTWTFLYNNYLGPTAPVGHCGRCHVGADMGYSRDSGVPDMLVGSNKWALNGTTPAMMYDQLFQGIWLMNPGNCDGGCPSPPPDMGAADLGYCVQPADNPNAPDMFSTFFCKTPYSTRGNQPVQALLTAADGGVSWSQSRLIQPGPQPPGTPIVWMTEPAGGFYAGIEANMPFDLCGCPGFPCGTPGPASSLLLNDPAKSRIKRWVFAGAPNN